jgi:hypothetical protein
MTITEQFTGGLLSIVGLIAFSLPGYAAESGKQSDAQTFQQQRSDKTQQGQDLVNKQPMTMQSESGGKQSTNTGADLSGGRDSHLGPRDAQGSQKKDAKGGGGTGH